jgi:pimeloyl-ACP methyl ester carboxylesterase
MPTLSIDGSEFFYKEAGSGPAILLIHGTSINADTWGECFDVLAESHRVVAYDRRGHSRSRDVGATGDWDRHCADGIAVAEQLELGPATVVGWSAGGIVALKLALARPDLVTSLVLVEPGFDAPHNLTARFVREFMLGRLLVLLGREKQGYERFMRFVGFRRGATNSWLDPDFPEERREIGRANSGSWRAESAARRGQPTPDEVAAIQLPVTVVLGAQSDPWFHKMANAVPKAISHAEVVRIPGANHAFGFTAPRELAKTILDVAAHQEPAGTVGSASPG